MSDISCSNCGEHLDPSWAHMATRPTCPACGQKGVSIAVATASETDIAKALTVGMRPQHTERDWRQRWMELQREWAEISAPMTSTMSGNAINSAHHRFQSFLVQCYHLKDALRNDPHSGVEKSAVESAIDNDPRLALLADLANLDKHFQHDPPRTPRSGDVPEIAEVKGEQPGSGGGWQLRVEIKHRGKSRDGLDVAGQAMEAWRDHLERWGAV